MDIPKRPPVGILALFGIAIVILLRFWPDNYYEYWNQHYFAAYCTLCGPVFGVFGVLSIVLAFHHRIVARKFVQDNAISVKIPSTGVDLALMLLAAAQVVLIFALPLWPATEFQDTPFSKSGVTVLHETPELHPEDAPKDINRFDREKDPRVVSSLEDYQRLEAKDDSLVKVAPALLPWQYSYVAGIASSLLGFGLLFLGLRFVNEAQDWMDPQGPDSSDAH